MNTVKFYTLGCKVNQYDTQAMREQFISAGFKELSNGQPAQVCVINSCTVTHRADADSLAIIRKAINENPAAKVVLTGCLAELDDKKIQEISDSIIIVKNHLKQDILSILNLRGVPQALLVGLHSKDTSGISNFKNHTRAFLKIQDGCNNFCSYCKVPLVRGQSRSKDLGAVIKEAQKLIGNGFKEIVLTGICLGAYGKDLSPKSSLVVLIGALESIDGLLRIRLSSIEAGDVTDALIRKMAGFKKLCRHLHIPIQSGDDEILKKMRRKYTRQDYLNLIKRIKSKLPGIAITTDVLVGFPGESEENFENSVRLVKAIIPLKVHIFPYSKRDGTLAAGIKDNYPDSKTVKQRIAVLKSAVDACALAYQNKFIGKEVEVLVESRVKGNKDEWQGHTDNYLKARIRSRKDIKNQLVGCIYKVS